MSAEPQLIQSRHGPLYAHPDDRYLGEAVCRYGEYSELEFQFLRDILPPLKADKLPPYVIEVGANAGYLTVPLMECAEVLAFEPQQSVYDLCFKNIWAASRGKSVVRASVIRAAVADDAAGSEIRVPIHSYETPGNHGGIPLTRDQSHAAMKATAWETVPCVMLDRITTTGTFMRVALIKADVEGMELNVLRGAREIIARDKPLLYLENDRPAQSAELIRYVWKLGYWCAWHCPPMFNPDNYFKVKENIYGGKASINMICCPRGQQLPPGIGRKHELKLVEDPKLHPVLGM